MKIYFNKFLELIHTATFEPADGMNTLLVYIAAIFACGLVLYLMGLLFDMANPSVGAGLMMAFIGVGLMFGIAAVVHVQFGEQLKGRLSEKEITVITSLLVSLVLVIPMIRSLWRGRYLGSAISWTAAVTSMMGACLAINYLVAVMDSGSKIAKKSRARSLEHERLLE